MFSRNTQFKMMFKMLYALKLQRMGRGPSLIHSNRPCQEYIGPKLALNRNRRLTPKPMTQDDVSAVRKLTGYAPFLEVSYL